MHENRIIFGQTSQTLVHVPPAYVATATYTIEDLTYGVDESSRVIASGSATVASFSVTSTAAAGADTSNPNRFTATTTAGTVGEPAALYGADGSRELVEIEAISLNAYVDTLSPIAGSYPTGSTLRGLKLSASFPDVDAADDALFDRNPAIRVTWVYTLDGVIHRVPRLIELVRHSMGDLDVGATTLRLLRMYPDLSTRLPDSSKLEHMVVQCAEDLGNDLRAYGQEPDRILLGPQGSGLLRARVMLHAAKLGYAPGRQESAVYLPLAQADYTRLFDRTVLGVPGANTATTSRAADSAASHPDQTYRSPLREM